MKFSDAYAAEKFGLSFELFPPKTPSAEAALWSHLNELMAYRPNLVTCTYGALGSTRDKTLEIVTEVRRRYNCAVASHLTCVGSTVDQLRGYLNEAHERGVQNIVALRGDPPRGETAFKPVAGGLSFASELVALIRHEFPQLGIAVAGYPETHREAASAAADLENLRRKVAAGGDIVITQLFYDNADFFAFRRHCQALGIRVPIVNVESLTSFSLWRLAGLVCRDGAPREALSHQGFGKSFVGTTNGERRHSIATGQGGPE